MQFLTNRPVCCMWHRRLFCRNLFTQTPSIVLVSRALPSVLLCMISSFKCL